MEEIKNIVSDVIGKISLKKPDLQGKIDRLWENILNTKEQTHTRIDGVKDGKLFVCVDSPAWLYQMNLRKRKILERFKEEDSEIKSIIFKIGKVK